MKSRTHLDAIGGTQGKASVETVHPTPATPERRVLVPHSVLASQINAAVEAERADRSVKIDQLISETGRLWHALRESVKLQAHYAKLLNMHDGGERIVFKSAEEWIERLKP